MNILKRVRRLACKHEFGWSEHRRLDVCYHCGETRVPDDLQASADQPPTPDKSDT